MCLSNIYKNESGENKLLAKEVAYIKNENGKLICYDIMNIPTEINGRITSVDLMDNTIIIE